MAEYLVPIAISSQLDVTGEERIHAAKYEETIRNTFVPPPPPTPLYMVVGDGGKLYTAPDADTWTLRTSGTTSNLLGVAYGNEIWVAVGNGSGPSTNNIRSSVDGFTWTARDFPSFLSAGSGLTFGGGMFVVVGSNDGTLNGSKAFSSPDGITWTERTLPVDCGLLTRVAYGNGLFVASSEDGCVVTSADGITWAKVDVVGFFHGVAYGNDEWIITGDSVYTSPDGVIWTLKHTPPGGVYFFESVGYTAGVGYFARAVGGFDYRGLWTSADAITWVRQYENTGVTMTKGLSDGTAYSTDSVNSLRYATEPTVWNTETVHVGMTIYDIELGATPA